MPTKIRECGSCKWREKERKDMLREIANLRADLTGLATCEQATSESLNRVKAELESLRRALTVHG